MSNSDNPEEPGHGGAHGAHAGHPHGDGHGDVHAHEDHAHGHGHHGSRFIQHHYDDAQHQFDAAKLGIWFFLAQEVLFFSGLFVAYILYRHHHPEIYAYAHHYLDVKWGAINTAVLIISSLSAAWAVRCAQLAQKRGLIVCLVITIVCACGFLGIKYIEYSHKIHEGILWGRKFDPCVASGGAHLLNKENLCGGVKSSVAWDVNARSAKSGCLDAPTGYDWDPQTRGIQGKCKVEEVTYQGSGAGRSEAGRRIIAPCEPGALLGTAAHGQSTPVARPCFELARNPHVCPKGPAAMVLYGDHKVRKDVAIAVSCEAAPAPTPPVDAFAPVVQQVAPGEATFKKPVVVSKHDQQEEYADGPPPEHTNMFFSIYFAMTGLHGLHVLVGIFVFIWLLVRAIKGHFTPDYFGPIDYAALYWHLVDLIWIFLFPLLYLIH